MLISKLALAQALPENAPSSAPSFSIEVERDDRAASCPDLAWFSTRIASHAGKGGHAGNFKLTLTKRAEAWQARIVRWEQNDDLPAAERVLRDRSPACEPLAEAAALTIAILADDIAQRGEPVVPPPAPVVEQPVVQVVPPPSNRRDSKLWVGAGGGAALSWISPIAPVLGFSVGVDSPHLHQGLRLMLTNDQKFELGPGRVFVQAWLATGLSCLRLTQRRFGVALCGAADLAMLRASAEGFVDGKSSARSYGALGLEAHPSWYLSDSYRLSAVLGAMAPLTRESFSVTGSGMAYVPPSVNWRILVFSEIGVF